MKYNIAAHKASKKRAALAAGVLVFALGAVALAGCAGQAGAADQAGTEVVAAEAAQLAGKMVMPDTHYANAEQMQLNPEFTQCNECHEGVGEFVMDGQNDLLSKHVIAFEDAGNEVDCVLCHDASVNGTAMSFEELDSDGLCMGCHNIDEVADATEDWNGTGANPHRLNHGVFQCTSCHTMHTDDQTYYCNKCHHFELPEGWTSPEYIGDSEPFQSF